MQVMIIVDVETTGMNPRRAAIASIGAVDFDNPRSQFYAECRVFTGAEINPESLKVNGFTQEQLLDKSKPSLNRIILDFMKWLEFYDDLTIAGQNPTFDRDFLNASFRRYKIDFYFSKRTVDLHSLCYSHMLSRGVKPPVEGRRTMLNTDLIHNYCGLPDEPKPHNGLVGAQMEAESFSRLIHGRNLLDEYAEYTIPDYLMKI